MILRMRQIMAFALALSLVFVMATGMMAAKDSDPVEPQPMVMAEAVGCPACHLSETAMSCAQLHCALPVAELSAFDPRTAGGGVVFADPARLLPQISHRPNPRPA